MHVNLDVLNEHRQKCDMLTSLTASQTDAIRSAGSLADVPSDARENGPRMTSYNRVTDMTRMIIEAKTGRLSLRALVDRYFHSRSEGKCNSRAEAPLCLDISPPISCFLITPDERAIASPSLFCFSLLYSVKLCLVTTSWTTCPSRGQTFYVVDKTSMLWTSCLPRGQVFHLVDKSITPTTVLRHWSPSPQNGSPVLLSQSVQHYAITLGACRS